MVGPDLKREQIDSGAALLEQLDTAKVKVDVALWHFSSEREKWKLVLSLPQFVRKGPLQAYKAIHKALARIPEQERDVLHSNVTLSPAYDEMLKRLRAAGRKGQLRGGLRISHHGLQGMLIEDAYIYRLM